MRAGTKTLLFGVHQVFLHPLFVSMAWLQLYRRPPGLREAICILVHDWGYWGKSDLDGVSGQQHPFFGAALVGRVFGDKYSKFVLLHSRVTAAALHEDTSRLCVPDKLGIALMPTWLLVVLSRLSGEWVEYLSSPRGEAVGWPTESLSAWFGCFKAMAKRDASKREVKEV